MNLSDHRTLEHMLRKRGIGGPSHEQKQINKKQPALNMGAWALLGSD